jgi:hypothetical protein
VQGVLYKINQRPVWNQSAPKGYIKILIPGWQFGAGHGKLPLTYDFGFSVALLIKYV